MSEPDGNRRAHDDSDDESSTTPELRADVRSSDEQLIELLGEPDPDRAFHGSGAPQRPPHTPRPR